MRKEQKQAAQFSTIPAPLCWKPGGGCRPKQRGMQKRPVFETRPAG